MLLNNRLLMERCLNLAKKANGKTSPNPMVGSVIVSETSDKSILYLKIPNPESSEEVDEI